MDGLLPILFVAFLAVGVSAFTAGSYAGGRGGNMEDNLKKFFATFNLSTHTLVGVYALFMAFLASDATARGMVFDFLNHHPYYSMLMSFVTFTYAKYSGSHSTLGQVTLIANTPPQQVEVAVETIRASSQAAVAAAPPAMPNLQNVESVTAAVKGEPVNPFIKKP